MPSTTSWSTSSLPFASAAIPHLTSPTPPPIWILHGRLAALPFCGRGIPWWRQPWHTRPDHERLRRDLQGDEKGELQPETEDILSRGESKSCKDKNSAFPHFLKCPISSTYSTSQCKLKCQETWWETCHQMKYVVEFQSPAWTRYVSKGRF